MIHGGVPRDVRKTNIADFNDDPEVRILIANDAAGEGVNLQRGAHLSRAQRLKAKIDAIATSAGGRDRMPRV